MPEGDTIFLAARTLHRALADKTVTRFEAALAPLAQLDRDEPIAGRTIEKVEAALGIVYATDARVEPGVKIVGAFPADSHPAIVYPVAATTTAKPQAAGYLAFLRSTAARSIFEKYGFKYLVSPTA